MEVEEVDDIWEWLRVPRGIRKVMGAKKIQKDKRSKGP